MKRITLKPKEERRLLRGHSWAYRNEFYGLADLEDGDVVDVVSAQGRFVGRGFYQGSGGIAVRLLDRHETAIDAGFFKARVQAGLSLRQRVFPGSAVYRWVFGESDGLPGLMADRYGPVVSAQSSCGFYTSWAKVLADAFLAGEGVEGVRLAVPGGVQRFGTVPASVEADMDGVQVQVDLEQGQKTGLFLDQRLNWQAAARYVRTGDAVFDGHCYQGVGSCTLAKAGAHVTGVDSSGPAIEAARGNAERNGVAGRCQFSAGDVQAALAGDARYDMVVLDPPALAKSRTQVTKAMGLYQALNRDGLKALKPGGIMVTSSCSHFVDAATFLEALKRAARSAGRNANLLELRGAPPDHPIRLDMPETAYLKCAILQID